MGYVSLNGKHNEYFVDDETYAAIAALIKEHKHCTYDYQNRHPYTPDNPCVGKNICLEHLLQRQKALVYAGHRGVDSSDRRIHRFLDGKGIIYTAIEDYSEDAKQSMDETLAYYGFTPPTTIMSRGKIVNFYAYYATPHGDLQTASVIVLAYNHSTEKVRCAFLLYKNGPTKELSKKSELYRRAEELIEGTKDTQGQYHINGHIRASLYEADVYAVVSQLESAMYDVTRKLQNDNKPTEEEHGKEPVREEGNA